MNLAIKVYFKALIKPIITFLRDRLFRSLTISGMYNNEKFYGKIYLSNIYINLVIKMYCKILLKTILFLS